MNNRIRAGALLLAAFVPSLASASIDGTMVGGGQIYLNTMRALKLVDA
jgi:hypothetical protein